MKPIIATNTLTTSGDSYALTSELIPQARNRRFTPMSTAWSSTINPAKRMAPPTGMELIPAPA
jgi:hypothetical protein